MLMLLAVITCVVVDRQEPEQVLTLLPADLGKGDSGRAGGSAASDDRRPEDKAAKTITAPTAPEPETIEMQIDALLPAVPSEVLATSLDPSQALLQTLGDQLRDDEVNVGVGRGGKGKGTGEGFGDYLEGLGMRGLDIVFVLDATNSMQPYINEAKQRLRDVLKVITGLVDGTRFGVVAYKDYGDDYGPHAVRTLPLTDDVEAVRNFIDDIIADGGGDLPEPIHEALAAATDRKAMEWGRTRKQVIILVGDSPIHSSGRDTAMSIARDFAKRGGTLNVIDVGAAAGGDRVREHLHPDLRRIAQSGKGVAFLLRDQQVFWRHLIISVFDKRYEQDVDAIIEKFLKEE
jgi:hypothetical protein